MASLTALARATLREAGVTAEEWSRRHFADGHWLGDACGCPDDRCIGFHHAQGDGCSCLPILLDDLHTEWTADGAAALIWGWYQEALGAGDEVAARSARGKAEVWVNTYHPGASLFSLDELIGGQAGISIIRDRDDQRRLVWTPDRQT